MTPHTPWMSSPVGSPIPAVRHWVISGVPAGQQSGGSSLTRVSLWPLHLCCHQGDGHSSWEATALSGDAPSCRVQASRYLPRLWAHLLPRTLRAQGWPHLFPAGKGQGPQARPAGWVGGLRSGRGRGWRALLHKAGESPCVRVRGGRVSGHTCPVCWAPAGAQVPEADPG